MMRLAVRMLSRLAELDDGTHTEVDASWMLKRGACKEVKCLSLDLGLPF